MFRFIFRTVFLFFFLLIVLIGLVLWKGGDPFIWIGERTERTGRVLQNLGYELNEVIGRGRQIGRKIRELTEDLDDVQDASQVAGEKQDGPERDTENRHDTGNKDQ